MKTITEDEINDTIRWLEQSGTGAVQPSKGVVADTAVACIRRMRVLLTNGNEERRALHEEVTQLASLLTERDALLADQRARDVRMMSFISCAAQTLAGLEPISIAEYLAEASRDYDRMSALPVPPPSEKEGES